MTETAEGEEGMRGMKTGVECRSPDEGAENYRQGGYHPVRIGDLFKQGRYMVQSKLGWGNFSTVWLAIDTQLHKYVALKLHKGARRYTPIALKEIAILEEILAKGNIDQKKCVVELLDHFNHNGPNGQHVCIVFELLGDNLLSLIEHFDYKGIPLNMVKEICFNVLVGLDYLHGVLSIIHTDLKPENILLPSTIDPNKDPRKSAVPPLPFHKCVVSINSSSALNPGKNGNEGLTRNQEKRLKQKTELEGQEAEDEPEKEGKSDLKMKADLCGSKGRLDNAMDHNSKLKKNSPYEMQKELDLKCKIADFGNACWTNENFTGGIQARYYKCPEVLLQSEYSTSADMWSFACIAFELATGDTLFHPDSGTMCDIDQNHLALMIQLLGEMPKKIAFGGKRYNHFFDTDGGLQATGELQFCPLKKVLHEKYHFCEQQANGLTDFLVPLLNFEPEKRPTAAEALAHPWLSAEPPLLQPRLSSGEIQNCDEVIPERKTRTG